MFAPPFALMKFLWLFASTLASAQAHGITPTTTSMEVNTVVGVNGNSTVECWTLNTTVTSATSIQQLGSIEGATYSFFPGTAPVDAGTHTAPNLQYFIIIKGGATITFPAHPGKPLSVQAGQFYIAADGPATSDLGHHTELVGGSLILQLPFAGGVLPEHTASVGQCRGQNFAT